MTFRMYLSAGKQENEEDPPESSAETQSGTTTEEAQTERLSVGGEPDTEDGSPAAVTPSLHMAITNQVHDGAAVRRQVMVAYGVSHSTAEASIRKRPLMANKVSPDVADDDKEEEEGEEKTKDSKDKND